MSWFGFQITGAQWVSQYATVRCVSFAIYLHCIRFAYLLLMKQGFNFLLLEINITLLEQMGGGRMGSMEEEAGQWHWFRHWTGRSNKIAQFPYDVLFGGDKLGSNVIWGDAAKFSGGKNIWIPASWVHTRQNLRTSVYSCFVNYVLKLWTCDPPPPKRASDHDF